MIATKFQRLYSCSWGRATRSDKWEYCPMSECVVNQRWWPLTGSRYVITHISACIHYSNEISTAVPMFSGSDNRTRLLWKSNRCIKTSGKRTPYLIYWQILHAQQFSRVVRPRKHVYNHWNFVAIVNKNWDMCYVISTSAYRPQSLIYEKMYTLRSLCSCLIM